MARGAQSAGLVTYKDGVGTRKRVVNGKRTDLCDLLMAKFASELRRRFTQPTIFQGHTRFATTSIAGFDGCHPHQFSPPRLAEVWRYDPSTKAVFKPTTRSVEAFVTHNGDLEFFELHDILIPLHGLQALLPVLLHTPLPNSGDSVCVAGLLDLLRTAGVWRASVRFGYVYGALEWAGGLVSQTEALWSAATLNAVTRLFEEEWRAAMAAPEKASLAELRASFASRMQQVLQSHKDAAPLPSRVHDRARADGVDALDALAAAAVDAFFDNGLLRAARILLEGAKGSFGLVLSTSLEADGELIVAARGQTMSVAFYPEDGLVLFGSEAAATKAAMRTPAGMDTTSSSSSSSASSTSSTADVDLERAEERGAKQSLRLDLDDVNGEVLQLRWGEPFAIEQLEPVLKTAPGSLHPGAPRAGRGCGRPRGLCSARRGRGRLLLPRALGPSLLGRCGFRRRREQAQPETLVMRFGPGEEGALYARSFLEGFTLTKILDPTSEVHAQLQAQGRRWAQHVLESPYSQLLIALYIGATVVTGWTPLSAAAYGISAAAEADEACGERPWWGYVVGVLDAVIYFFLPWWTTVLLRLLQGRPWLQDRCAL